MTTTAIVNHNGLPAIKRGRHEWQTAPSDEAAARTELAACQAELDKIQFELAHPLPAHHDGRPIVPADRQRWREEANFTRIALARRARFLKGWLHERSQSGQWSRVIPGLVDEVSALRERVAALEARLAGLGR